MNIAFSGADLVRFGIILYVVTWLVFVCYLNMYAQKKDANVHRVALWYFITVATRHWGWIVGMVVALMLTWILPDVYIVAQDPERTKMEKMEMARKWMWADTAYTLTETFYVDKCYVPFSYQGHTCSPFSSYLLNTTDSTLVIYSTDFFNGQFTRVSDIDEFEIISPGYFQPFDKYISNKFSIPSESSLGYVPKDRKNKSTTEWTISLMMDAVYDTERIRERIKDIGYLMEAWQEGDSLRFKENALEVELNRLRRRQDAKQKSN